MALDVPYRSIPDMFLKRVAATPDRDAFARPAPDDSGPVWLSWAQVAERAKAIAAGLRTLGVRGEDRVAILANTRIEWVLADLGIMCAGAATTTVYPTTKPEDATYIIGDSGSRVLIVEDPVQAAKIAGAKLPTLSHVVLIDGAADSAAAVPQLTLAELEARGAEALAADPEMIERIVAGIEPDHLATLIYTSGTTGRAKGVELLHEGWCWEGVAQAELGLLKAEDLQYLWLPHALLRQDAAVLRTARRPADLCRRPGRQARGQPRAPSPATTRRCRMWSVRRRMPSIWRWRMTRGASVLRSCSPPRLRPVCAWSVAGR